MDLELSISLERTWTWKNYRFNNVNIEKINHQLELEDKFKFSGKSGKKAKQTTLSDFIK